MIQRKQQENNYCVKKSDSIMGSSNNSPLTVSVIIPTRNEEQGITECLTAVFNQTFKPFEVIVVDGRSTDNTIEVASKFPVKIFTESEPSSLPNARNVGVENSQGEILFIMDSDVILSKDCIMNAVKYFEDPQIIGVIPVEDNVAHSRLEKIQIDYFRGSANPIRTGIGISVFAEFLRKSVFEKTKFDSGLGYGEDGDFQRRLLSSYGNSGKIVRSSGSMISAHYSHSLKELFSQYSWYGRTFRGYLKKNFALKPLLNLGSLLAPASLIVSGIITIIFPILLPLFIVIAALIIARNLLVCVRSRRPTFFEFIGFEFLRSMFFTRGLFQGLFSKKKGR
jgi:glycosyltransferase involved in cell wall biosynthesis